MPKRKRGSRQSLSYRRFATAAEAIRFAVEEFPSIRTLGAWMQVGVLYALNIWRRKCLQVL
jgi:hypothetical protein